MTTHDFVYQTFIIYICLKAAILLPLCWFTYLVRRAEKQGISLFGGSDNTGAVLTQSPVNTDEIPAGSTNLQNAA